MYLANLFTIVTEGVTVEILTGLIDTGATLFFLYLLITAKLMPSTTVDRILQEAESRSAKITKEILSGMKEAVKQGHLEADAQIKNGKN